MFIKRAKILSTRLDEFFQGGHINTIGTSPDKLVRRTNQATFSDLRKSGIHQAFGEFVIHTCIVAVLPRRVEKAASGFHLFTSCHHCSACPLYPQERTCAVQYVMSALPPIADMCDALAHVRFVPIADIRRRKTNVRYGPRSDVVHRVHHKEEERRLRATLAAIRSCGRPRVDDLPLRLENIERALWVGPRRQANRPLRLTILPPTNVRFEVMRRNVCSFA